MVRQKVNSLTFDSLPKCSTHIRYDRKRQNNASLEHDGETSKETAEDKGCANRLQQMGSSVLFVAAIVARIRSIAATTGKAVVDASACAGSGWARGSRSSRRRGRVGSLGVLSTAWVVLGAGGLRKVVAHVVMNTFLNPLDAGVVRNCQSVLSQVGSLAVAANAGIFKGVSIAKVFVDRTKILLLANKGAAGQFVQAPVLLCAHVDVACVDPVIGGDKGQGAGKSQESSAVCNHYERLDFNYRVPVDEWMD